jgi:pectate lyase
MQELIALMSKRCLLTAWVLGAIPKEVKGGAIYRVTNLNDSGPGSLRQALESSARLWIVFDVSGTIVNRSKVNVRSFKTIDGRGRNIVIEGRQLQLDGCEHVIIYNMRFRNSGDGDSSTDCCDTISMGRGTHDIWVHHCDFGASEDEIFGITKDATDITISFCHLKNAHHAFLIGQDDDGSSARQIRLTLHHNRFEKIDGRCPKITGAKVHSFNNYYDRWQSYLATVRNGAQFYSKADIYRADKVKNATEAQNGNIKVDALYLINGAVVTERNRNRVFEPKDLYTFRYEKADNNLIKKISDAVGHKSIPHPLP